MERNVLQALKVLPDRDILVAGARLNRFLPDRFILEYKVNGETRRWTALIWPPNLRATLGQAWRQGAGLVSNIPRRRR